jgi:hypothetical protein
MKGEKVMKKGLNELEELIFTSELEKNQLKKKILNVIKETNDFIVALEMVDEIIEFENINCLTEEEIEKLIKEFKQDVDKKQIINELNKLKSKLNNTELNSDYIYVFRENDIIMIHKDTLKGES